MADDVSMIKNLYSKLEEALFLGDRIESGEFGCLMNPGQFVNPSLVEDPNGSDDMAIQFLLTDAGMDSQFLYTPTSTTVSGAYDEIIEFRGLPNATLSADQEKELQAIRKWLKDHRAEHEEYEDRYYIAVDAYNTEAKTQAPNQARLQRLAAKRAAADKDRYVFGYKGEWDRKTARLIYLLDGDPTTFFEDLRTRLADAGRRSPNRGDYYNTFLYPPVSMWSSPEMSWAAFSETVDDTASSNVSRSTSWGGGLSLNFGLWRFGGGTSGSSSTTARHSEQRKVDVSFEYARVSIIRPWLHRDLFRYRFWAWKKAHGFTLMSDGGNPTAKPPQRPIGPLPVIAQNLIVVRNVELRSQFTVDDQRFHTSQWSARASFGWGPFRVGGNYSRSTTEEYVQGHFEEGRIAIEHPQVIGFSCALIPRAPNPDLSLAWDRDEVALPDEEKAEALRARRLARLRDYETATLEDREADAMAEVRQRLLAERLEARLTLAERVANGLDLKLDF